jgi:hypothetical protein
MTWDLSQLFTPYLFTLLPLRENKSRFGWDKSSRLLTENVKSDTTRSLFKKSERNGLSLVILSKLSKDNLKFRNVVFRELSPHWSIHHYFRAPHLLPRATPPLVLFGLGFLGVAREGCRVFKTTVGFHFPP